MPIGKIAFAAMALALGLAGPAGVASAQNPDPLLAERVLGQVMRARDSLKANCAFDILRESPLGDLDCKSGAMTAVGAWDAALTQAGLPAAERDGLAERLGLTPAADDDKAGLWRADPRDVVRLIANLRLRAGG